MNEKTKTQARRPHKIRIRRRALRAAPVTMIRGASGTPVMQVSQARQHRLVTVEFLTEEMLARAPQFIAAPALRTCNYDIRYIANETRWIRWHYRRRS